MKKLKPLLILASNYSQFKAGVNWLGENGYIPEDGVAKIVLAENLRGMKGRKLFIMEDGIHAHFGVETNFWRNFQKNNQIFDMKDLRDPSELKFEITERVKNASS